MLSVTKVETFLAGNGPASRAAYFVARAFVAGFTRTWTRMQHRRPRARPARPAPFVLAPVHRSNMDTPIARA